jgi:hypothetical protein
MPLVFCQTKFPLAELVVAHVHERAAFAVITTATLLGPRAAPWPVEKEAHFLPLESQLRAPRLPLSVHLAPLTIRESPYVPSILQ